MHASRWLSGTFVLAAFVAAGAGAHAAPTGPARERAPAAGPDGCPEGATVDVTMGNFFYDPADLSLQVGDVVRWTNEGPSRHTSTEDYLLFDQPVNLVTYLLDPPLWDSGDVAPDASYARQFCDAGTFAYHCEFHVFSNQRGTISVV